MIKKTARLVLFFAFILTAICVNALALILFFIMFRDFSAFIFFCLFSIVAAYIDYIIINKKTIENIEKIITYLECVALGKTKND